MITNENKLTLKFVGNIVATVLLVVFGLYLSIKDKNYYLGILFAIGAAVTIYQCYKLNKIIKNKDYFEIDAKCISSNFSSLGYSMTSSKIFNFKIINKEDVETYNIDSDEFTIQAALSSLKEFKEEKAPYQIDSIYRFMFKKSKNDEPTNLSNTNMLNSYLISSESTDNTKNKNEEIKSE